MWVAEVYSYLSQSTKRLHIFLVLNTSWMSHAVFHHPFLLVCTGAATERDVSTFFLLLAIHS